MIAKLALTNYPFDRSYSDTLSLLSFSDRSKFFNFPDLFATAQEVNFKIANGLTTTVTYRPTNPDLLNDLNCNYAIVGENEDDRNIRYYFVKNITYDITGQYNVDLEIDVMMTYDGVLSKHKNLITRFDIDTSYYHEPGIYVLEGLSKTPIATCGSFKKIPVSRIPLNFVHDGLYSWAEQWLNDNVKSYEIYLCKPKDYGVDDNFRTYNRVTTISDGESVLSQPFTVFVVPIFKDGKDVIINDGNNGGYVSLSADWISKRITSANIYAKLVTRYFPINLSSYAENTIREIRLENENTMTIITKPNNLVFLLDRPEPSILYSAIFAVVRNDVDFVNVSEIPDEMIFSNFKTQQTAKDFRGNLQVNYDCRELVLTTGIEEMSYKPLYTAYLFSTSKTLPEYDKPYAIKAKILIAPESVKTKCAIYTAETPPKTGIVYTDTFSGLANGLNVTSTNQITIAEAQIDVYMANNKNFAGIMATNALGATLGTNVGGFNSTTNGRTSTGSSMGLSFNPLGGALSVANDLMQLDNLNNAPVNIKMAGNSPEYNIAVLGNRIYLELRESTEAVINAVIDDTVNNGYYVNIWTEKGLPSYYGYEFGYRPIKMIIGYIVGSAPDSVKQKIKDIYARGIRRWYEYEQI